MSRPTEDSTGIAAIGLALPALAMNVSELARVRGVDPAKFTTGLGCQEMALCAPDTGVVDLAEKAARRALARWGGDPTDIGLIAVGTETAMDMSRPLSAFVAERLGLQGAMRSYEIKHACYGGTVALRQALEWRWSGANHGKAALVIAADVALYAENDGGEPTQGAGAVAFVVADAAIAAVDRRSFAWAEPVYDFWRPVGEAHPRVDGKFSLTCYNRAAEACFVQWIGSDDPRARLRDLAAVCFHVPFPKMVKKAAAAVGARLGLDEAEAAAWFAEKIEPTMAWNLRMGNAYTASLWFSVAHALCGRRPGETLAAFSYGSGFGAELLTLTAGPAALAGDWATDVAQDLASRKLISGETYMQLRRGHSGHAVAA